MEPLIKHVITGRSSSKHDTTSEVGAGSLGQDFLLHFWISSETWPSSRDRNSQSCLLGPTTGSSGSRAPSLGSDVASIPDRMVLIFRIKYRPNFSQITTEDENELAEREVFPNTINERMLRQWQQTYLEKLLCLLQCFLIKINKIICWRRKHSKDRSMFFYLSDALSYSILSYLVSLNIQLEAVLEICSLKLTWQSMYTPRSVATVTGFIWVPSIVALGKGVGNVLMSCGTPTSRRFVFSV